MGGWVSLALLALAGWAALHPWPTAWIYLVVIAALEIWLFAAMRSLGSAPVSAGEPPYDFTADEAALVGRYRFYFTYPALSGQAASVLAAIGLSGLVLGPWLVLRQEFVEGGLAALNLLAVGWLTRRVAPVYSLRLDASRGKREALRMLEAMDPAWAKIRKAAQSRAT